MTELEQMQAIIKEAAEVADILESQGHHEMADAVRNAHEDIHPESLDGFEYLCELTTAAVEITQFSPTIH